MKITVVSETFPPEINGVALTVQSLALGLDALGHDVEVIRPRQPEDSVTNDSRIHQQLVRGIAMPRYHGLRFGLPTPGEVARRWRQQRPDAIYVATEGPLGRSALLAARSLGIPACTGFHTRFDDFARHYGVGLLSPLVFAWMRRFHNSADATLVPTKELADFLIARGFNRVQLLRRAVSTTHFNPARRDNALRTSWGMRENQLAILHVGRIASEKNLDLATRAFRAIQQRRPDARFIVVGDGPTRLQWQSENPDFIFSGMQRGDNLGRHFASADVFLFPSLSETFGNVTLEAMASGLATVAFDYGAAREHIQHGLDGMRIDRDDEQRFVDASVQLACEDAQRGEMGRRARCAVKSLDPASVAENFAALLASLAHREAA